MTFDEMDVAGAPRELVALGGCLDPETLRAAYRNGVFPWPASVEDEAKNDRGLRRLARRGDVPLLPRTSEGTLTPWVSPHPRAVLLTHQATVPKTVRQLIRRNGWETTVDERFDEVIHACADRADGTWITPRMVRAYTALHAQGGAHSLEVWDGTTLIGGLYGVLTGRVFSGESMFFRVSGASKVALVALVQRLVEAQVPILDTQQETPHLAAMGQVLVHRADYVAAVRSLRDEPAELSRERRPA